MDILICVFWEIYISEQGYMDIYILYTVTGNNNNI